MGDPIQLMLLDQLLLLLLLLAVGIDACNCSCQILSHTAVALVPFQRCMLLRRLPLGPSECTNMACIDTLLCVKVVFQCLHPPILAKNRIASSCVSPSDPAKLLS